MKIWVSTSQSGEGLDFMHKARRIFSKPLKDAQRRYLARGEGAQPTGRGACATHTKQLILRICKLRNLTKSSITTRDERLCQ